MVNRSDIPKKNIYILLGVSLFCSISIAVSYFIWNNLYPNFDAIFDPGYLIISIILAVFSLGASILILFLEEIKPLYLPTTIWVGILIIYGIISTIYPIIILAVMQFIVDIWFYRKLE